jgi:hypothetical protein
MTLEKVNQLDLLFRKTKTKPHLYWLPLTDEQVAAKQKANQQGHFFLLTVKNH